jgi:Domain of unknown function (DUF1906)
MIGFDYSAGPIAPGAILAAGCQTVFRYVSTPGNPKNITASELAALGAAGIGVGLVYETTANWMLGGHSAGVAAAKSARAQATAAGYGPQCRIWYAADFDPTTAQVSTVLSTLQGCVAAEGSMQLVDIYGGLAVVRAAANAGFTAPWQTTAWSGGVWDSRALIRQTGQELVVGGVQVDVNTLMTAQLGQWTLPTTTNEDGMPYLISVTPDPTNAANTGAGIFTVDAGIVVHVPDGADATTLAARFGAPVTVTPAYYKLLIAAQPTAGAASAAAIAAAVVSQLSTTGANGTNTAED